MDQAALALHGNPGKFCADALYEIAYFRLAVSAGMVQCNRVFQDEPAGEMIDQEGLSAGRWIDLYAAIGDAVQFERRILGDCLQSFSEFL